ncbi:MAG: YihY/virulence factor BrkB family protein [Thermoanaerobaculia bacterium]
MGETSRLADTPRRVKAFIFWALRKSRDDRLGIAASALAFSSVLSLVPLLALISRFVARAISEDEGRTMRVLAQLLPYSEKTVITAINSFVAQSDALSGLAMFGFLLSCASCFLTIEGAIDQIFRVERRKGRILHRIFSFSLVVFWGPLAIAGAVTLFLHLAENPALSQFARRSTLFHFLPAVITLLGLTALFWWVPNRKVHLRNALYGAAAATLALHGLQTGFRAYVKLFSNASRVVYGSFAIAFFFMLSVQIAWWIILVGAEIAASLELGKSILSANADSGEISLEAAEAESAREDSEESPLPTVIASGAAPRGATARGATERGATERGASAIDAPPAPDLSKTSGTSRS